MVEIREKGKRDDAPMCVPSFDPDLFTFEV